MGKTKKTKINGTNSHTQSTETLTSTSASSTGLQNNSKNYDKDKKKKKFNMVQMPKSAKNLTATALTQDQKNMMKKECQSMYGYSSKNQSFQEVIKSAKNMFDSRVIDAQKPTMKKKSKAEEINLKLQRMNAALAAAAATGNARNNKK